MGIKSLSGSADGLSRFPAHGDLHFVSKSALGSARRCQRVQLRLGLYDGIALTERWGDLSMELPDRIFVFRSRKTVQATGLRYLLAIAGAFLLNQLIDRCGERGRTDGACARGISSPATSTGMPAAASLATSVQPSLARTGSEPAKILGDAGGGTASSGPAAVTPAAGGGGSGGPGRRPAG